MEGGDVGDEGQWAVVWLCSNVEVLSLRRGGGIRPSSRCEVVPPRGSAPLVMNQKTKSGEHRGGGCFNYKYVKVEYFTVVGVLA